MKSWICLTLAVGLIALTAAGCSQTSTASSGGGGTTTPTMGAGGGGAATTEGFQGEARNFNLQVRCPGVHLLKSKGWTDQQIMQQLEVSEDEIPTCEQYIASLPKGYVPPPPPGVTASAVTTKPAAMPAPAKTQ